MNAFAFISLISAMLCLSLGVVVLHLHRRTALAKIFFITILFGFIYSFTTAMMWSSSTPEEALIWHKLGTIWPIFCAAVFNFALIFSESKWIKFKIHYIALYLPALVFFLIDLLTSYINTAPVLQPWGYNDLASGTWLYVISTIWSALLPLGAFIICFRYYLKAKEDEQRKRAKFVSIGLFIPIAAFIITNMIGRGLDLPIPNLGPLATVFFAIFVTLAIAKYDLFTIDAVLAAENIVSTIPDSLILATVDANILKVNDRLVQFLGYSKDELIGQPIAKLCSQNLEAWHILLLELERERTVRDCELMVQTKSGEARHVLLSASVVTNQKGRAIGLTCVLHDISERKVAEQELANTKNYLETLLNSMLTGVLVINGKTHRVVDANSTALSMIGLRREEVVGRVCNKFVCSIDAGRCPITDLGFDVHNDENILLTADGKQKQILKSVIKLRLNDELLFIENFIDISQRKTMEAQLVKAQQLASIGELAGQLGHDLRNPLAGIKNGIYLVKKKGNSISEDERREILKIIEVAIEDSNRIVTSLIEYSNEMMLTPELTTPKRLVSNALTKLTVPSNISIQNNAIDETPTLLDTAHMENVFLAVLRNAIQATPEKGTVKIAVNTTKSSILFSFTDTGVGIPEDIQSKLFTPLVTTKAKGMGMSLAICKRVVEAHGGKIEIESKVGEGTTVNITLPLVTTRKEFADLQASLTTI